MGELSPIQCGFRIGRKGADQSNRAIGHNGAQILILEIAVAAKRCELARSRQRCSFPGRCLPGGVNDKIDVLRFANANAGSGSFLKRASVGGAEEAEEEIQLAA
jgi:hypothetical protein